MNPGFAAVVLDWLRLQGVDAASVEKVETYGTDWAGDTEGGFHSQHEVSITYLAPDGSRKYFDAEGPRMVSLWSHVVGAAWPA